MNAAVATAWDPEAEPELQRADAPREPDRKHGWFRYARVRLKGATPQFWILQVYLVLFQSRVDEHWESIAAFRPRLLLGALLVAMTFGRRLAGIDRAGPAEALGRTPTRWLSVYLVALLASTLLAFDTSLAKKEMYELFVSILTFYLLLFNVRTRGQLLLTIMTLCLGIGLFLAVSYWEFVGGRYDYAQGVVRMLGAGGTFSDPNSFGATIVFMVPLMVWVAIHSRAFLLKAAALAYGGLTCVAVFYTSSRSALVLLGLSGLWALWMLPRGWPRRVAGFMLVALAVGMLAQLSDSQRKRIESLVSSDTYKNEESTVGRIRGYEVALEILEKEPIVGVGPGNWSAYRVARIDGDKLQPHNLLGQALATRGIVGTLAFFGFLIAWWRLSRQRRRILANRTPAVAWDCASRDLARAMVCGAFLLLVSGLGAHNMDRPNWFWFPAIMILGFATRPVPADYEEMETVDSDEAPA